MAPSKSPRGETWGRGMGSRVEGLGVAPSKSPRGETWGRGEGEELRVKRSEGMVEGMLVI